MNYTKQQKQMIDNYNRSTDYRLEDVYKTCSWYKQHAEQEILQEMHNIKGYDYRITRHNSMFFSCAYRYTDDDNTEYLIYHTPTKRHRIILKEL